MSENPTAEELVRNVTFRLQRSNVIPMPIDPTLSNAGEAADAKATGEAISNAVNALKVNGKSASSNAFTIYATDISMSDDSGAQTVAEVVHDVKDRTAEDIIYDPEEMQTIKGAIDEIKEDIDTEIEETEIDDIFEEVFGGGEDAES